MPSTSFNSLFEMRRHHTDGYRRREDPSCLSILYLRCGTQMSAFEPGRVHFDLSISLFEMQVMYVASIRRDGRGYLSILYLRCGMLRFLLGRGVVAFNSLFEMRLRLPRNWG